MDQEPWRCRRTDGKKWRCRKPTITNEKYCEKHMHRGSKLSRKPQNPDLTNPNPDSNSSNYLRITNFQANLNEEPHLPTPKIPTTVVIKSPSFSDKNKEVKNVVKDKSVMNERIAAITLSSGLDFSPKSVFQNGQKYPRVETSKIDLDPEAERCRRTDGKRWRCRKNVLPNQKYCANHINRGVKRSSMALSTFVVNFSVQKQGNLNFSRTINLGEPKHDSLEDDSETTMTDESADNLDINVLSS